MIDIKYAVPGKCSICGHEITITHFACSHCKTRTEGDFTPCKFCRLDRDQLDFIEVFLRCRGNIKDVEKELGISYPTIRNRLEEAVSALGLGVRSQREGSGEPSTKKDYSSILDALERGEITPQQALNELKRNK